MRVIMLLAIAGLLSGCVAKAAYDVVTLPVKVASAGVDAVTTSQEEADRNRGRELRKQEEREARERRKAEKARKKAERQAREAAEHDGY